VSSESIARASPERVEFQGRMLSWYRDHRRELPWRAPIRPGEDPDLRAYRVWVCEAMLQQTRVETACSYWLRFVEALPTVQELARASEERVLGLWSGLGYYRRARARRAAAGVIVERHGGSFPRTREGLRALPGVGPYTAGAVLSIAFDLPEPVVDGNVTRVLARWFALEGEVSRAAVQRELWELAGLLVPREGGAGDWNQALMELGATVCSPRDPDCDRCPVADRCRARREGRVEELPRMPARAVSIAVELIALLIRGGGDRLLLERRGDEGRMAGMWQLPTAELAGPDGGRTGLFPPALPAGLEPGAPLGCLRHAITRHRIRCTVHTGAAASDAAMDSLRWFEAAELEELALTGLTRKALRARFGGRDQSPRGSR
jgi:A/G-specific adenine glycosylase